MQKQITSFLLLLFSFSLAAQDNYFQQEVNTVIEVTLDDEEHYLKGTIEIEYINNSPDDLYEIYMHLWANAFKNRSTAFAKQKVTQGSSKFYFAKQKKLGRFYDLEFKINGETTEWNTLPGKVDIALIKLGTPLKSGERITITTPLNLKIPDSFSRLGHVGQSYQLTQWFPKPAVYDRDGWHPMSYVDMGEFYSEFGSYDVKITLPENYVVGATGELQNKEEQKFLLAKAEETKTFLANIDDETLKTLKDTFPTSSNLTKTLHYKAEQVHDFAFFADKRFYVQKSAVKMASGRMIDTWAMFTNAESWMWRKGIFYVDRAVKFYSDNVGEYPYPQATAVQSALSAGGGMEYPMITVIGLMGDPKSLDGVITHEVGHNWFYGILGFNERDYPWLDEGINSYYDHRYTEQFYENADMEFLPKFMTAGSDISTLELAYLFQARRNLDQAPATHSEDFELINYFLGGYEKPAVAFKWLEKYMGTPEFDKIMKGFYQEWEFKHPQPEDLRSYFLKRTDKDLSWFFDGLIGTNDKTDYAISKLKKEDTNYKIAVKNKGQLSTPFPINALKNDSIVATQWYDGFEGKKELNFPKGDYDALVIDEEHLTLDLYRKNNKVRTSGLFPKIPPLQFKFFAGVENPERTQLFYLPLVGYNHYDKLMLGLGVYNKVIPARRFEFALAPVYSFKQNQINGLGAVKYNIYPEANAIRKFSMGLSAKRFTFIEKALDEDFYEYDRLVPFVDIDLGSKHNTAFKHGITARAILIRQEDERPRVEVDSIIFNEETMVFDTVVVDRLYNGKEKELSRIYTLAYAGQNTRAVNPYSYRVAFEQQSYKRAGMTENYLKLTLELNTAFTYAENKSLDFRFFLGSFLQNTRRSSTSFNPQIARGAFALTHQGYNDYKYDHLMFGRSESNGIWSQQVNMEDGGMKNAFGQEQSSSSPQSNKLIFAINFKADLPQNLPLNIPLKPYFDIGYSDQRVTDASGQEVNDFSKKLWWSGGVMLDFDNLFSIHFPIFNSDNLKELYDQRSGGDYWARITWQLDLNRANPFEMIDNFGF
ncbi:MAG: M1 family metallopeptidase [Saprospiraceae bacterium]